ncbi:hypothetical protein [Martelella alba]|uniref:hypothetical protein n=1 Tax=Martelella alba TaxID=2590451 RepID=UPI0015E8491F|nr:hypothetical protein [Martelella alba]
MNIQVAAECDAARDYYKKYKAAVSEGSSSASAYWSYFSQTADLANEMYAEYGCAADY